MTPAERFLKNARNIATNPLIQESVEYTNIFTGISEGLFGVKFIGTFSSNVFPETLKFSDGYKCLIWDSAYWYIFSNIMKLYPLRQYEHIKSVAMYMKHQLKKVLFYFLSLKTENYPALSAEVSLAYRKLSDKTVKFNHKYLENNKNKINEATYFAKIFCLFHELNHIKNIEDKDDFNRKSKDLTKLFIGAEKLVQDTSFLDMLLGYYTKEAIDKAFKQIISSNNAELEEEIISDMCAFHDTISFFEQNYPTLSVEEIYSRVYEVLLFINSVNFMLIQICQQWNYHYKLCVKIIDVETHSKMMSELNNDTLLRFIITDILRRIETYELFKENEDILHTNFYGLRYGVGKRNSFVEDTVNSLTSANQFAEIYYDSSLYSREETKNALNVRDIMIGW